MTLRAPWTKAGRALEREIGGDYGEDIAAIEAEAAQGAEPRIVVCSHCGHEWPLSEVPDFVPEGWPIRSFERVCWSCEGEHDETKHSRAGRPGAER